MISSWERKKIHLFLDFHEQPSLVIYRKMDHLTPWRLYLGGDNFFISCAVRTESYFAAIKLMMYSPVLNNGFAVLTLSLDHNYVL